MVVPAPTEPKVRPLISWSFWKGYHLAAAGIPLIAHVEVVDIAVLQVEVALYITGQVKVVVDRRRYLAELRAVDTAAIAQSDLVLLIELIGSVGRGEEVAVTIVVALVARLVGLGVGDELNPVVFKADTGMDIQFAKGESSADIPSSQSVVSAVVVDLVDILEQVELVGAEVADIAQQRRHVHGAETSGQAIVLGIVPVHEVAGGVLAGAVLAVGTRLHLWLPVTEGKLMLVIDIG
jgi:hypothetical protein